jgi:hypothetical protein
MSAVSNVRISCPLNNRLAIGSTAVSKHSIHPLLQALQMEEFTILSSEGCRCNVGGDPKVAVNIFILLFATLSRIHRAKTCSSVREDGRSFWLGSSGTSQNMHLMEIIELGSLSVDCTAVTLAPRSARTPPKRQAQPAPVPVPPKQNRTRTQLAKIGQSEKACNL